MEIKLTNWEKSSIIHFLELHREQDKRIAEKSFEKHGINDEDLIKILEVREKKFNDLIRKIESIEVEGEIKL